MESSAQVRLPQLRSNHIRIGTAGWSYKDWDGIFYPLGMSRRKQHPLEYLARFFDTTEINTSFWTAEAGMGQALVPQGRGGE